MQISVGVGAGVAMIAGMDMALSLVRFLAGTLYSAHKRMLTNTLLE